MNGERTLQDLIQESTAGDSASFRTLCERLDKKLFSYLYSRTETREEAIDTLQDVLVVVWQSLRSFTYRSDEGFYRFVFTIAKRHLYRLRARPRTISLETIEETADDGPMQETHTRIVVTQALSLLDSVARDIVTLKHWSGFSFKEIGGLLSMKEETVRVRHHRALQKMRTSLETYV